MRVSGAFRIQVREVVAVARNSDVVIEATDRQLAVAGLGGFHLNIEAR